MGMTIDEAVPHLYLLSGFEVRTSTSALALKPSSQRLVAFLALTDNSMMRNHVAFRLWPDHVEARALANLRSALWRLRQLPATLVETTSTHIRLHRSVWVDVREGLQELTSGERGLRGDVDQAATLLTADLLPDWYDDWLVIERERLRQVRLHALERAGRGLIASECYCDAIDLGLRAIAIEPLRESAHRLVIEAHLAEGNRAEALRQYDTCLRLLSVELGVAPSAGLRALVSARA
jgi:DNA-binding SARP family transcriptional activator